MYKSEQGTTAADNAPSRFGVLAFASVNAPPARGSATVVAEALDRVDPGRAPWESASCPGPSRRESRLGIRITRPGNRENATLGCEFALAFDAIRSQPCGNTRGRRLSGALFLTNAVERGEEAPPESGESAAESHLTAYQLTRVSDDRRVSTLSGRPTGSPCCYFRNCLKSGFRFSMKAWIASLFSGPPKSFAMPALSSVRAARI